MVPTPPSEPFSSHESPLLWRFWGSHGSHRSQVLLLRVLNLTEVGGHFRLTRISLLWVFLGLTRIPQISQVLLLMVGNLTEVGGHFRLTRISLLWVFLGLTPIQQIQQEYSHGFRKKRFVKFVGFVVFNQPQISTNYHELFFHVPIVAPFLWRCGIKCVA